VRGTPQRKELIMQLQSELLTARRGFTLIEVLIVVVVLGILASITVPQFSNAQEESLRSATMGQLHRVRTQIDLYRLETGSDPDLIGNQWSDLVDNDYISHEPTNPYTADPAVSAVADAAAPGVAWVWREKSPTNPVMQLYAVDADGNEIVE
jgi:type II secretion system protein G